MEKICIGMLGFGTVGTGVAKLLIENKEVISRRVGAEIVLKRIADIDIESKRDVELEDGILVNDADIILDDPEIAIVLEMIGGETIAKELMLKALKNGKHVVTANKALLAGHGTELYAAAAAGNAEIAFEASVGGCMPIIKTIRESLVGDSVRSMKGILNGTCNYILSKITDEGIDFSVALEQATKSGYAEADPTLDISGHDTAHKLAVIAALAFGVQVDFDDLYIEGITLITPLDIEYAGQFGYRIKLLAVAEHVGDNRIQARVHPTMVPFDNILSNVNGSLNAITINAVAVDDITLFGKGAGMMPTGAAVVGDIVDLARNIMHEASGRVPMLSFQQEHIENATVVPMDELESLYYIRFTAPDKPGILAKIAGVLGKYNISIESVTQKGRETTDFVPIVMLTHTAKEADVKKALEEIAKIDKSAPKPVLIRIDS